MGTVIPIIVPPPPEPAGFLCPFWWGVGKPFDGTDTPFKFTVTFSGIQTEFGDPFPPPFSSDFDIVFVQESMFDPCRFRAGSVFPIVRVLTFRENDVEIKFPDDSNQMLFQGSAPLGETLIFNDVVVDYKNGSAKLHLPVETI